MSSVSFLRHAKFFGPEDADGAVLNIIGVGATGSWVGLMAAKMGWHNFQVWDSDVVESHNCANQAYDSNQVGELKVDAFETVLKRFNPDVQIIKHPCFYEPEEHSDLLEDAVFIAVDSLDTRKNILYNLQDNILLDVIYETRMGFNHAELNIIDADDTQYIISLADSLKKDSEVEESACNERIMTTLTNIVASTLVHSLCNHYSASRHKKPQFTNYKTIFQLEDELKIYTSSNKKLSYNLV